MESQNDILNNIPGIDREHKNYIVGVMGGNNKTYTTLKNYLLQRIFEEQGYKPVLLDLEKEYESIAKKLQVEIEIVDFL